MRRPKWSAWASADEANLILDIGASQYTNLRSANIKYTQLFYKVYELHLSSRVDYGAADERDEALGVQNT